MKARFLPYFFLMLLSGCAASPSPATPPMAPAASHPSVEIVTVRIPGEVDELLAYYQWLGKQPESGLETELSKLDMQAWSPRLALQKAMILTFSRDSGNLARTQALLDSVLYSSAPEAEALMPLAQLLAANVAARQRLSEQLEKLNLQVKEGQRRSAQLKQMLEGLKAIERTLPAPPGSAPATTMLPPAK